MLPFFGKEGIGKIFGAKCEFLVEVGMCVALIGGMDRLQNNYINEAKRLGIDLRVYTKSETGIASKVRNVDAVVIFTNKVSHKAKGEVMNTAKANNIPVFMYHSCGISTLRDCLSCLKKSTSDCLAVKTKNGCVKKCIV